MENIDIEKIYQSQTFTYSIQNTFFITFWFRVFFISFSFTPKMQYLAHPYYMKNPFY
jgi:hypothetical protein